MGNVLLKGVQAQASQESNMSKRTLVAIGQGQGPLPQGIILAIANEEGGEADALPTDIDIRTIES